MISELHDKLMVLLDKVPSTAKVPFANAQVRSFKKSLKNQELGDFKTTDEKFLAVLLNVSERPICLNCGKFTSPSLKKRKFAAFCSPKCTLSSKETHQKSAKTLQKKYGVSHNMAVPDVQKQKKKTMLTRYGAENPAQVQVIADRIKQTRKSKYSIDPLHTAYVKKIAAEARSQSFSGDGFYRRLQVIANATGCLIAEAPVWKGMSHFYGWQHPKCGTRFEQRLIKGQLPVCPTCAPRSRPQSVISDFLKQLGIPFRENCRRVISPLELDFVLPDYKIAIEVNGQYWHNDFRAKHSLLDKTKLAAQQGIQLLHFWDFEINEKPEIVFNIIRAKLKLLRKIHARQCEVVTIDSTEARSFLERTHLSGFAAGAKYTALRHDGEVVAVAVFGKNRFNKKRETELIRFAAQDAVVGGLSRLIAHFRRTSPGSIISFADLRISNGAGYKQIGFSVVSQTAPNYLWVKSSQRLTRYQTMKHRLATVLGSDFDESKSETDNMLSSGWYRISDCGNLKLILR